MGVLVRGGGVLARWLEYRKDGNNKAGTVYPSPTLPPATTTRQVRGGGLSSDQAWRRDRA
jgi:hypothetical protein